MIRSIYAVRRRHLGIESDRGAGTVEYLGAILVVGLIVGSLLMVATPIGNLIAYKLCAAVGATCGSPTSTDAVGVRTPKAPPEDACTLSSSDIQMNLGGNVGFVDLGSNGSISIDVKSDGTYAVTVGGALEAGGSTGPGGAYLNVDIGDYGVSAGWAASVGVTNFTGAGIETSFATADEVAEYVAWVQEALGTGVLMLNPMTAGVGISQAFSRWAAKKIMGREYHPPVPNAVYFEGGEGIAATGGAGAVVGGVHAALNFENALGYRVDLQSGDVTFYSRVDLGVEGAAKLGFSPSDGRAGVGGRGSANVEIIVATTLDSSNNLKTVEMSAAADAEGAGTLTALAGGHQLQGEGGKGVNVSASFDVTDANRGATQAALTSMGVGVAAWAVPGASGAVAAGAIPIILAEADRTGHITAMHVDVSAQNLLNVALSAKAPLVGGAGGDVGISTWSSKTTGAYYLGDHGWEQWTECL